MAVFTWGLFLFGTRSVSPAVLPAPAQSPAQVFRQKKHVKVWVNTQSGIYHCPGTRWYGKTQHGEYMDECQARMAGYRPAYHHVCGAERR